ncbi:MAG: HNH endonuclease, partial [Planctomycetes bacterium]|nr:HNH endonuclease [Planctomycetota bacterium]
VMDYFRSLVIAMHGQTRGYEVFDRIRANVTGPIQAMEFAKTLELQASDYLAILSPDQAKWNTYPSSIRKCIEALNHLRVKAQRPIMLATAVRFAPAEAAKAFNVILSWSVRFLIVGGGRSGSVEENYAKIAKDIWDGKIRDAKRVAKAGSGSVPNDAAFETAFATANVGLPYLARYYLRSLELYSLKDSEPQFIPNEDATQITLEHVVPKNPENSWGGMDLATCGALTNRLGNLALLQATPNSQSGNAEFSEKAKVYLDPKCRYVWTRRIGKHSSWGATEIANRQSEMAKVAARIWPLKA